MHDKTTAARNRAQQSATEVAAGIRSWIDVACILAFPAPSPHFVLYSFVSAAMLEPTRCRRRRQAAARGAQGNARARRSVLLLGAELLVLRDLLVRHGVRGHQLRRGRLLARGLMVESAAEPEAEISLAMEMRERGNCGASAASAAHAGVSVRQRT